MPYRRARAQSLDKISLAADEDPWITAGKQQRVSAMKALKAIVIGMGALIVLAVGLIGFGLYKKSVEPGWKLFGPNVDAAAMAAAAAPAVFDDLDLGLAENCLITDVRPDGRRAYLLLGPAGVCDGVMVIDTEDGRVLGRITPR